MPEPQMPSSAREPAPSAVAKYTPHTKAERHGIGLCLSGGGFRATLFHLGALRRLNELNLLGKLRTIASVSGGSLVAAHLASVVPWPLAGPVPDWEERVVRPLLALTTTNIRTWPLAKRLLPWNWRKSSTGVETLAATLEERLTARKLVDLPPTPAFVLCATDLAFGDNWVFEKRRMGGYLSGYITPPPPDWPLARATAASACFPPVFNPLPLRFPATAYTGGQLFPGLDREAALADLRLTDGGVYDNLGLEPVWKDHAVVLVSDGGAILKAEADENPLWRLHRYEAISEHQAVAVRKGWLIANFLAGLLDGAYWGIGSARTSYDPQDRLGYSKEVARGLIATIRTDLDAFSAAEAAILENHGYLLADKALQTHVAHLLPTPVPPLVSPHPEWLDDMEQVKAALADSGKRKILGRW